MNDKKNRIKMITTTAILAAVSTVLMFLDTPLPFMPSFIKFDISDMPALLASFAMGPVSGVAVALIKNAVNLINTMTGGVGELSNFLLTCFFVVPAGLIYKKKRTFSGAVIGAAVGSAAMALLSLPSNYFIVYPIYTKIIPMENIIGMYKAINPAVETLWDALIWFNLPFTFGKAVVNTVIVFLIYKRLSNLLKSFGNDKKTEKKS